MDLYDKYINLKLWEIYNLINNGIQNEMNQSKLANPLPSLRPCT